MPKVKHHVEVLHHDRLNDLALLCYWINSKLKDLGLHEQLSICVSDQAPPPATPNVTLFLGDSHASANERLKKSSQLAQRRGSLVLPIVSDLSKTKAELPQQLRKLNAMSWDGTPGTLLNNIVTEVFRELGIEEEQRRVFISHRRSDGQQAAAQLHDKLSHRHFQPFIDRYAIRKGVEFQKTIFNSLEDSAFLLLLETPDAYQSEWVFDEVEYALAHTMGILIVSWPGDITPIPGTIGLSRVKLTPNDLVVDGPNRDALTPTAIDYLIPQIESAHANGLVRRRRRMVSAVAEHAIAAGASNCTILSNWRLLVTINQNSHLIGTIPGFPTAWDLHKLHEAAAQQNITEPAVIAHVARQVPADLRAHLDWVSGTRSLMVMPESGLVSWFANGS